MKNCQDKANPGWILNSQRILNASGQPGAPGATELDTGFQKLIDDREPIAEISHINRRYSYDFLKVVGSTT